MVDSIVVERRHDALAREVAVSVTHQISEVGALAQPLAYHQVYVPYRRLDTKTARCLISSLSCHSTSSILRMTDPDSRRLDKKVASDIAGNNILAAAAEGPF
jgi:hypothetical protein